jgi:hypothetical protein
MNKFIEDGICKYITENFSDHLNIAISAYNKVNGENLALKDELVKSRNEKNEITTRGVAKLGAIIENHIDDSTWLMNKIGIKNHYEYRKECRIDKEKIDEFLINTKSDNIDMEGFNVSKESVLSRLKEKNTRIYELECALRDVKKLVIDIKLYANTIDIVLNK